MFTVHFWSKFSPRTKQFQTGKEALRFSVQWLHEGLGAHFEILHNGKVIMGDDDTRKAFHAWEAKDNRFCAKEWRSTGMRQWQQACDKVKNV